MLLLLCCLLPLIGCVSDRQQEPSGRAERAQVLRDTRATYCSAPRKPDGRVDVDRLVSELIALHANTYSFCIHSAATDWEDLQLILPHAREKGIRVWASLVPPSESPPRTKLYAEPFRLDYQRWAVEFAKLSLRETNLVAWSIDDFTHNLKFYTPAYLEEMLGAAHKINPKLAFVPCCYFPAITPAFVTNYCPLIDGILFPYRHESTGANLKDPSLVEPELKKLKEMVGPALPIVLDLYASAHSRLGPTTAEYLEQAMIAGHRAADGVMIYRHQDPKQNAEKYQIVKRLFGSWAEADARAARSRTLRGSYGTYDAEPRKKDGRVDIERLVSELEAIQANTYNWLVWHAKTDWDDLKLFLPLARQKQIRVWVTLVPPTESPPQYGELYSEPFRLDYERWAIELANLSLREPNLVAWSLDDFSENSNFFTAERLRKILGQARETNPRLAFVPCCYFQQISPEFAQNYRLLLDGILFPYRHESAQMNLKDTDTLKSEVAKMKDAFGASMPVFVDVYATHHSSFPDTTSEYVEQVMTAARHSADGVLIYCHQYEATSPEKYRVIKQLFHKWSADKEARSLESYVAGTIR